jgi:hypothetical protein
LLKLPKLASGPAAPRWNGAQLRTLAIAGNTTRHTRATMKKPIIAMVKMADSFEPDKATLLRLFVNGIKRIKKGFDPAICTPQ